MKDGIADTELGIGRGVLRRGAHEGVLVAPSILSADFADLAGECSHVLLPTERGGAGADLLHIDVMDGHFVPNLSMGPVVVEALRRRFPNVCLDVHLMVTDPVQYIDAFAKAGVDHATFHVEPVLDVRRGTGMSPLSAGYEVGEMIERVRDAGMSVGLAINPETAMEDADRALGGDGSGSGGWGELDMVLVMSVHPGFSGQAFIEESLGRAERVRGWVPADVRIEMDGGVTPAHAGRVKVAGVDVLVAASAVFGAARGDRAGVVAALRGDA